jgi:hypothetical protein
VIGLGVGLVAVAPFGLALVSPEIGLIVGLLWLLVLLFPLIYVSLGLQLAPMAAAMDGLGPVASVRRGWAAAEGNRLNLFVLNLVFGILGAIGMCLCCIPAIPVIAVQQGGMTAAWLLYARAEAETDRYPFFQRNGTQ